MAKPLFSLASWNVERFQGKPERASQAIAFLREQDPDVFVLHEVEGKLLFGELVRQLPGYQFHITEGTRVQEMLVGVRQGFTAFFTQRLAFHSGPRFLRPGPLLTLSIDGVNYSLLFLHTKSGASPLGMGIRDDQFNRAFHLKLNVLDEWAGGEGKANLIVIGDFSAVGMEYPFGKSIDALFELQKLERDAARAHMRRLTKTQPFTWWNARVSRLPPADLDQVVASSQLQFHSFNGADVEVRGWPQLASQHDKVEWIRNYSDHALLYLAVEAAGT